LEVCPKRSLPPLQLALYGLEANRKTLDAFLRYHFDQGLAARRLSLEEIFVPSTLSRSRI